MASKRVVRKDKTKKALHENWLRIHEMKTNRKCCSRKNREIKKQYLRIKTTCMKRPDHPPKTLRSETNEEKSHTSLISLKEWVKTLQDRKYFKKGDRNNSNDGQ